MFDEWLRAWKDRMLAGVVRRLGDTSPTLVSVVGFGIGAGSVVALTQGLWLLAAGCWLINRTLDGIDGALARHCGRATDLGAYLDIMLDFTLYAAIPVALAAHQPSHAKTFAALVLLAVFYLNAASWMYLAALLERRGHQQASLTGVVMPRAVIGGTETIFFYTLFILLPQHTRALFLMMAGLVAVNVVQRMVWSARRL